MLSHLHIENIAVVKCADIDFSRGFIVFTGETGAGKSVIIDCLSLISGEKISKDSIRYGEREGVVEALFEGVGKTHRRPVSFLCKTEKMRMCMAFLLLLLVRISLVVEETL